jgi:hypothetical protein
MKAAKEIENFTGTPLSTNAATKLEDEVTK